MAIRIPGPMMPPTPAPRTAPPEIIDSIASSPSPRAPPDDKPTIVRELPGYLSHRDLVNVLDKALGAPMTLRYDIFHAVSDNARRWRDIDHTRRVLGWEPLDSSDAFDPATLG